MMQWLAVAIGGALGSMARFGSVSYITPWLSYRWPIGTLTVNVLGSLLIGVAYVVLVEKMAAPSEWRLFFITGVLGGFTTFSAFSLEILRLGQDGQLFNAFAYALGSVATCLFAVFVGVVLAQKIF